MALHDVGKWPDDSSQCRGVCIGLNALHYFIFEFWRAIFIHFLRRHIFSKTTGNNEEPRPLWWALGWSLGGRRHSLSNAYRISSLGASLSYRWWVCLLHFALNFRFANCHTLAFLALTHCPTSQINYNVLTERFKFMSAGYLVQMLTEWELGLSPDAMDLLQRMVWIDPRDRLSLRQVRNHPWMLVK